MTRVSRSAHRIAVTKYWDQSYQRDDMVGFDKAHECQNMLSCIWVIASVITDPTIDESATPYECQNMLSCRRIVASVKADPTMDESTTSARRYWRRQLRGVLYKVVRDAHVSWSEEMILLSPSRPVQLSHKVVSSLLRGEDTPIFLRASVLRPPPSHPSDLRFRSWLSALPGIRSCPDPDTLSAGSIGGIVVTQECWQNSWTRAWNHFTFSIASFFCQTHRFIRSLWKSFKKSKIQLDKNWPEVATRTLRELCQQRMEWTLDDATITDRSCMINIAETCCKIFVVSARMRDTRKRRAARFHWHASYHRRVLRHQSSRVRRSCSTFFFFPGEISVVIDLVLSGEPHLFAYHCHNSWRQQNPYESASWIGVPCTSVKSSWPCMWRRISTSDSSPCRPLSRSCDSRSTDSIWDLSRTRWFDPRHATLVRKCKFITTTLTTSLALSRTYVVSSCAGFTTR